MPLPEYTNLVLGTAGHIDHGKSSLVKAMTGVDPDRLAEEKRRGITIELGFAKLNLTDGTNEFSLGIVDVPGHERFVRHMIAGATGIDLAMLVIAADDGVMPQTLEHLSVLQLLGVTNCVVALSKIDAVEPELVSLVFEEITQLLASTPYNNASIVPVSAKTGAGIDELKGEVLRLAKSHGVAAANFSELHNRQSATVRLPVDRVFTIKGRGTVITGTLWSGSIQPNTELQLLSNGEAEKIARVRTIQVHNIETPLAVAGNRVALNLPDLKKAQIAPGDFLATPGKIVPTDRFDAFVTNLDTLKDSKPLKTGARVHVAHGTKEILGRLLFMDKQIELPQNQSCYAQIRLQGKLPLSWNDRFIVRSGSPLRVVAGGIVLSSHPRRRTNLSNNEWELIKAENTGGSASVCRLAFANLTHIDSFQPIITAEQLSYATDIDISTTMQILADMVNTRDAIALLTSKTESYYTSSETWQIMLQEVEKTLLAFHQENPNAAGISKSSLSKRCNFAVTEQSFDALLTAAMSAGLLSISEDGVSHVKAGGASKQVLQDATNKLLELLQATTHTPPTVSELIRQSEIDSSLAHKALRSLENVGKIIRISDEFCFLPSDIAQFRVAIENFLKAGSQASTAQLKEAMKTSRKYAVPLLEYFDKQGITRRKDDMRELI